MPGLIDSHVHLFMSGTADPDIRQRQLEDDYIEAQTVIARHLSQHLSCGIVAVRDGGDRRAHVLQYKNHDLLPSGSPVILRTAGRAWRKAGRYGKLIGRAMAPALSLAQGIAQSTDHIDHVKIVNSGLNSLTVFGKQTAPQFDVSELRDAVAAASARGLPVMVHANGKLPVKTAVQAGCTSIEHGFFMGAENLQFMAERGTYWVPTAGTMQGYAGLLPSGTLESDTAHRTLEDQLQQLIKARELGVKVVLGTDAGSPGVHHGTGVWAEMRLLLQAGFPVQEAVRCATANGAALLSLDDRGELINGKSATFMAAAGEPSGLPESLAHIEYLFIDGRRIVQAASKNRPLDPNDR
jgi:imidazolonepropionase-like amidohydrolase